MLIAGILITIVAIFMVLVPQFFMRLKSPRIPDKLLKNPKMKIVLRVWGNIFVIVGILLIIFSAS
jgi:signal transduction histidine kinase